MTPSFFYLFSSRQAPKGIHSTETVFYRVDDEKIAKTLCALFTKQFTDANGLPNFDYAGESHSEEDSILMDEAIDSLSQYDDPDRFVYDPPPTQHTIELAAWARQADRWEDAIRARTASRKGPSAAPSVEQSEPSDSNKPVPEGVPEVPEMSPEDKKNSGLALLLLVAQAYYKLLESVVSMASWVSAVDLNLNQSYLWVVSTISTLLKNHDDLKDFPEQFEPIFPDLFPSTIRDTEWDDEVAPHAEAFLSAVHRYVISKGLHELEEGSQGWFFVELYRPSVNLSIDRASAYNKRMRQACDQMLKRASGGEGKNPETSPLRSGSRARESASSKTPLCQRE